MHASKISIPSIFIVIGLLGSLTQAKGQMITGVWHGKIDRRRVEIKIIQNGDSLTGTSYYYESATNYKRYSIKGYFDVDDNSAVWWDDQLIEDKSRGLNLLSKNKSELARADFNCPGGGVMKLDGKTYNPTGNNDITGEVHLDKVDASSFSDEWNFVIDNYTVGANDPDIIDSVALVSINPTIVDTRVERQVAQKTDPVVDTSPKNEEPEKKETVTIPVSNSHTSPAQTSSFQETKIIPPNIEQKFASREKIFTKEIPLVGDSIELRFYDNAEVDGDSISLFLNDKLIFEHIRLTEKAYVVKLSVSDLNETNELTMVAENLGSIPPNTSYMVALVGEKRYDAQLASTENSSAMIKLRKTAGHE